MEQSWIGKVSDRVLGTRDLENLLSITEMEQTKLQLLLKVKKNQIRMLMARGYEVGDEANILDYDTAQFTQVFQQVAESSGMSLIEALSNYYPRPADYQGDNPGPILVFWIPKEGNTIGKEQIRGILEELLRPELVEIRKLMLIVNTNLSASAKQELDNLPAYRVEIFHYNDLSYNPLDNYLVPKHTLLSSQERAEFLKGKDINKLPLISLYDPIAKYYGAVPGQIFKIERIDLSGLMLITKSLFYRLVVDVPLAKGKVKEEK